MKSLGDPPVMIVDRSRNNKRTSWIIVTHCFILIVLSTTSRF